MKFDPNATEERSFPVLPAGEYEFDVEKVEYVRSKSGIMNWKLTLAFESRDGIRVKVFEYFPEKEGMDWKFAQFFKCIGVEASDTSEMKDVFGEVGKASLYIEAGQNGYPDRNRVKQYIPAPLPDKPKFDTGRRKAVDDDDLPF